MAPMTNSLDPKELLAEYDAQARVFEAFGPVGATVHWDGPLKRTSGMASGGFITYRDLAGLQGDDLDALIARQVAFFRERGEKFEWKTRGHDLPADLTDRLVAHGFAAEDAETVVVGLAAPYATDAPARPADVTIRQTADRDDYRKIADLNTTAWGQDLSWLETMLAEESTPDSLDVFVAEADGKVVSAAWIRYLPGSEFAGLNGGTTHAEYRGRGIYKALVAVRAAKAIERGYKYLHVDCTEDSRPILQRLGFVAITTTTPYVWRP